MNTQSNLFRLVCVLPAFFAMGAVDLVGIASNYVKEDFGLSDTMANLFPSMVFFWFFIFSVPAGLLMNRTGRKKTVLLSLIVTALALILPVVGYTYPVMLLSFSLLGIGNTLMQVSLNPLMANIVSEKRFASALTFGQFVKAIASFAAPLLAGWAALHWGDWKLFYPVYAALTVFSLSASVYGKNRRKALRIHLHLPGLFPSSGPRERIVVLSRHHVSRWHRRRHQRHGTEDPDGTYRGIAGRCRHSYERLLPVPRSRLLCRNLYTGPCAIAQVFHCERSLHGIICLGLVDLFQHNAVIHLHSADRFRQFQYFPDNILYGHQVVARTG
jgi:MFS family permease